MKISHIYLQEKFGENWFTFPKVYSEFVTKLPNNGHIIEIGSWKGKSAAFLCVEIANSEKNIRFDCIDSWLGSKNEDYHQNDPYVKHGTLYELFMSNMTPLRPYFNPVRMESAKACNLYQDSSVDIIFIDSCHDYDCVKNDIQLWLPKVKKGGILAGHDYWPNQWDGVREAVDELLGKTNIVVEQNCWIFNK
jgi:hypothetical protein